MFYITLKNLNILFIPIHSKHHYYLLSSNSNFSFHFPIFCQKVDQTCFLQLLSKLLQICFPLFGQNLSRYFAFWIILAPKKCILVHFVMENEILFLLKLVWLLSLSAWVPVIKTMHFLGYLNLCLLLLHFFDQM